MRLSQRAHGTRNDWLGHRTARGVLVDHFFVKLVAQQFIDSVSDQPWMTPWRNPKNLTPWQTDPSLSDNQNKFRYRCQTDEPVLAKLGFASENGI